MVAQSRFTPATLLLLLIAWLSMGCLSTADDAAGYAANWADRYADQDPAGLVVPCRPVTRKDYLDLLRPYAEGFERGPDRGQYGPRHALPALAVFALKGDRKLGEAIMQTLRHYGRWVDQQIATQGGVSSMEGATLLALYFREFRRRGLATAEDEAWLKQMLLKLRQYQMAWRPGDGLWRGSHHRSITQGCNHLLCAALYPQEPDAPQWRSYGEAVWNDWWSFRDVGINDTSYFYSSLSNILRTADLLDRREVFTDPEVRRIVWDRLVHETSPDGSLIPYGSHGGYNGLAGVRIWAMELAARHTGDGRYRFIAGRMMNFGQARGFSPGHHHLHATSIEPLALAALACDDSVEPMQPDEGSWLFLRPEIIRLTDQQAKEWFPEAGGVDCNMYMTERMMPHKLVLRSGWKPGDLTMLVECYPRHDPLNPTAILALERYSSSFAEMTSEKFISRENAVMIEDLSGQATFVGEHRGQWPEQLPLGYDRMESTVDVFADHPLATHARLRVSNYMGFKARQTRELLFVKNRFVLVRDETVLDDSFRGRIGPVWNTQHVGEPRGANWLNTWFTGHWFQGVRLYDNPPWDLLIYYAPRPDTALTVTEPPSDTTLAEPKGSALGKLKVTRYAWEGDVRPSQRLQFVSLLVPHAPSADATPLAEVIHVLRDEPGLAVASITMEDRREMVALNSEGRLVEFAGPGNTPIATDAAALYLELRGGEPVRLLARQATTVKIGTRPLHESRTRSDFESNP